MSAHEGPRGGPGIQPRYPAWPRPESPSTYDRPPGTRPEPVIRKDRRHQVGRARLRSGRCLSLSRRFVCRRPAPLIPPSDLRPPGGRGRGHVFGRAGAHPHMATQARPCHPGVTDRSRRFLGAENDPPVYCDGIGNFTPRRAFSCHPTPSKGHPMTPPENEPAPKPEKKKRAPRKKPAPETAKQISQARRDANRKNAQLSTGPTSPEGKAISSRNSFKHGHALVVPIPDEDPDVFDTRFQQVERQPRGRGPQRPRRRHPRPPLAEPRPTGHRREPRRLAKLGEAVEDAPRGGPGGVAECCGSCSRTSTSRPTTSARPRGLRGPIAEWGAAQARR